MLAKATIIDHDIKISSVLAAGAYAPEADFQESTIGPGNFMSAILWKSDFSRSHLEGALLAFADLSNAKFVGAKMSNTDLRGVDARLANFSRAELTNAILANANLEEAKFYNTKLSNSDLSLTNLRGANLKLADLSLSNLSWANLTDAKLLKAKFNCTNIDGAFYVTDSGEEVAVTYDWLVKKGAVVYEYCK